MPRPQRLVLIIDGAAGANAMGNIFQLLFRLLAEISDDEGHFLYFFVHAISKVFNDAANNGLSGDRKERLWGSKRMGAKAGTPACHGDDDFHNRINFD